jgi:murein DD-endopeptidase MepM/ murein hydrolase activator NlpD
VKQHYLIKIVPPWGYRVFRLRFTPPQIALAALTLVLIFGGTGGYYAWQMHHAEAKVGELRNAADEQRRKLERIDAEAADIDGKLRALERQNDEIRGLMGVQQHRGGQNVKGAGGATTDNRESMRDQARLDQVSEHLDSLLQRSSRLRSESSHLQTLALHVLNMRRLEDLARARVLAAIPSLDPVESGVANIASPFGWRFSPWPEFHKGVDLEADYEPVRATAAGTVVAAGYDGGYGVKVDIDHGNGYHTWYCHLSRADVNVGAYVRKAQHIAVSGSTGASTGPHLHYQIMLDGKPIDPTPYLSGVPPKVLAQLK